MDYLLIINIILTNSGVLKLIKLQIASVVCRRSTMSRHQFTLDEKIGIIGRLENGEKNSVIRIRHLFVDNIDHMEEPE
jgi:hypothetical protein